MANLSLGTLNAEVRAGLGNRVEATLTDLRIASALNIAQQRLGRFYDYQELNQDMVATALFTGNPAIDKFLILPTGTRSIHSLVLQDGANSRKLKEKPWRMFDKAVPLVEYIAPGWPKYYTRFGVGYVMLFPAPLQAFSYWLRATILPPSFDYTNPSMVSSFIDKDDILIFWALEYLFRLYGRPDISDEYDKMALSRAREAKANDEDRPDMDASMDDLTSGVPGAYWQQPFQMTTPG